jgi:probable HAF family extracellular repeat protein
MIDLGTLGGDEAHARDINNLGQVVGESKTASGDWHAFLWDSADGMRDLGTLGGASSWGYGINDLGQVVGYSEVDAVFHAFLYSDGAMHDLGTLDYVYSAAFDVNNHTQAVGTLVDEGGNAAAFLYDGGALIDLGTPLLSGSQTWVINNPGLAAGHSWAGSEYRSYLYAAGTVVDMGTLDGFVRTYAFGISDTGQVVGSVTDLLGGLSHAVVYTGGELQDLNDLLVGGHGWDRLTAAYAVNSAGQIVGYGQIGGEYRAFLLTPAP